MPTSSESSHSGKHKVEETPKSSEGLTKELEASLSGQLSPQEIAQLKAFLKKGQDVPPLSPTTLVGTSNTTEQQQCTNIVTPITSLTHLQSNFGNPNSKIVFVSDLTPISPKEMPPSDFFFSKKRKAIVKRESYHKDGVITKRKRMVYDGNDQDDPEFAKEVAGSSGAFATANQWSLDNLTEQLRHKCPLVDHLQNQIYTTEKTIRNNMSQYFEQIKAHDRQQIQ
jgi:hypothetical protein